MKIAIITPYASPEKGACSIRVESFKNYFEKNGHEVTIFAPVRDGITKGHNGIARYSSLKNLMGFIRRGNFDVVIGTSYSLKHIFFILFLCKIKRIPFILDTKELLTHMLLAQNVLLPTNPKFKIYKTIEKLVYTYADKIFVLTPLDKEEIVKSFSIDESKVTLVMNGTDTNLMRRDEEEGRKIRELLDIPADAPVLVYAGGLGDEEIIPLLEHSADVVSKYRGHFLFVLAIEETSQGAKLFDEIMLKVKVLRIGKNFHVVKNIEYFEVYKYLSASNVGIIPWPSMLIFSLPVKIFDYMACELLILAKGPENGSMHDFFVEYDVGYYATTWNEFKENLNKALRDLENFKKKGVDGRKIVEREFARENANKIALKALAMNK